MTEYCKRCGTASLLARDKTSNGATQVFYWCVHCGRLANGSRAFLSHTYVTRILKVDIDSLPVIERYPKIINPCAYAGCPNTNTEEHHFAPRHLFTDAELWPKAFLCAEHHRRWHQVVTPAMCEPKLKVLDR